MTQGSWVSVSHHLATIIVCRIAYFLSKISNYHRSHLNTNSQLYSITILLSPFLQPTQTSARRIQITFRSLLLGTALHRISGRSTNDFFSRITWNIGGAC